ncbi:MAG: monovalent cation/H(+) antiporter subunit G [Lachnospiraceae bacterium]|nr:monovalent cation/H(+) antiporter subunit G [Lachnospiraceae bacterium]
MIVFEWLRLILGIALLIHAVTVFTIEVIGVFKMNYSLNRIHAAAMGDTMGLLSGLCGLMLINGLNFTTLKMLLVLIFLWLTSPVASHLIAKMEYQTNRNLSDHATFNELSEVEKELLLEEDEEV